MQPQHYSIADDVCAEVADRSATGDEKPVANKGLDRRDFLTYFTASVALASSSCVRRPAEFAIPYVKQPIDQTPGVATYYSSTCGGCPSACGIVVKTREGRAVKIEGNPDQQISNGALCPLGQASLQGLYHPERYTTPQIKRADTMTTVSWDDVYLHLGEHLKTTNKVGILCNGSTGHRQQFFREFLDRVGAKTSYLFTYESNQLPTFIAQAHLQAFGRYAIPRADLDKAKQIVGIGSDFLDQGVSRVFYAGKLSKSRDLTTGNPARLSQFESQLTLTGARADQRVVIAPNSEIDVALALAKILLTKKTRATTAELQVISSLVNRHQVTVDTEVNKHLLSVAERLIAQPSVVLCGSSNIDRNAKALQQLAIAINIMIGAYDDILDLNNSWHVPATQATGLADLERGLRELDTLLIIDNDPFFTINPAFDLVAKTRHLKYLISMQPFPNSCDQYASHILPTHHFLESWGDEQPLAGHWSLRQPTMRPITDSRQAEDILLWLLASANKPLPYRDYRSYLRQQWQALHKFDSVTRTFDAFFHDCLQRGTFTHQQQRPGPSALRSLTSEIHSMPAGLKLSAPLDNRLHDGRGAHLPVLQEVGDSLTTIAWDSWLALSVRTAQKLGFRRNDVIRVKSEQGVFEAALFPMPGLHDDAVVVARGNGHKAGLSKVSESIGVNPLVAFANHQHYQLTSGQQVTLIRTGKIHRLVAMQKENRLGNRGDIVKSVTIDQLRANNHRRQNLDDVPDLYPELEQGQHRWGVSVDLHKCIGCSACMVACAQENNVPQVGRTQVAMGREMHWLRLDRYFSGDVENPRVTIQPMMCQQCNHAPCEAVCPVYATTHDSEGINAMTYNRCVGTRYCANACPYKVRRFNWWTHKWNVIDDKDYNRNPRALNPDVTVRTRGVMEKCNFCYQRIRDGKHKAKAEKRVVADGEIMTACQQTCPTQAITFGNLQDSKSKVAGQRRDYRAYLALGGYPELKEYGLKTLPNVSYLADVTLDKEVTDGHG